MSIHQQLMDATYNRWQLPANIHWSKAYFYTQLSADERFAVVTGNLNYQVTNGGFAQWWDNGYATREVLDYLLQMLPAIRGPNAKRVYDLIVEFDKLTHDARKRKLAALDDEESDSGLECDLDDLDTQYYKINDAFLVECENYLINKRGEMG